MPIDREYGFSEWETTTDDAPLDDSCPGSLNDCACCDRAEKYRAERDRVIGALREIAAGTMRPAHYVAQEALGDQ